MKQKYKKKKEIWKNLIINYTNKLHDMLNDLDMREDIIQFIKEKYESESAELKNQIKLVKGANGFYLNFQRAIYQF